jgi:hypothetical protein
MRFAKKICGIEFDVEFSRDLDGKVDEVFAYINGQEVWEILDDDAQDKIMSACYDHEEPNYAWEPEFEEKD